ncbi:MAG: hypothetical protein LBP59_10880 [Planctomycetaceae bacterium]|jgi:hypothetical protein|nr:hypothetical protein [Planctomycetaceae bacterium]
MAQEPEIPVADSRSGKHRLDDGHPTVISLAEGACLWEKALTPPGIDGGGANETTTMHNIQWRTNIPKHLRTMTDTSFTAAYAVVGMKELRNQINKNQITVLTFGDGTKMAFWGWLNSFAPGEVSEGTQPTASCSITASNQDNTGKEMKPNYFEEGAYLAYNSETGTVWQMNKGQEGAVGETANNPGYTGLEPPPDPPTFNPLLRSYGYICAKQCELWQRIRENREDPKLFRRLRNGVDTMGLYDSFDINDVRQKIRDYFGV